MNDHDVIPNLVPTQRTINLVERLLYEASHDSGTDAILNHLDHLPADQTHAVIALLLDKLTRTRPVGRPRIAVTFTPEERRRAHAAYGRGERDEWTMAGEREYQRTHKRMKRPDKVAS